MQIILSFSYLFICLFVFCLFVYSLSRLVSSAPSFVETTSIVRVDDTQPGIRECTSSLPIS